MAGPGQLNIYVPTVVSSLFLYNINACKSIELKLIPNQLAESYSPKIISESPFGILHPINFYVGGNEKSISFDFEMHEDMPSNSIDGSIYKMIDELKKLSKPVVKRSVIKPPLVYLQLGNQFAGKGHITTSFGYKKPFSNGRYKLVSCSMSFVFHELFSSPESSLFPTEQQPIDQLTTFEQVYTITTVPQSFAGSVTSIEDFYQRYFDYDYVKEYSFENQKIANLFNFINMVNDYEVENIEEIIDSGDIDSLNGILLNFSQANRTLIPMIVRLFATYLSIIKNYGVDQLSQLNQLLNELLSVKETYGNPLRERIFETYEEFSIFKQSLLALISIVEIQIYAYEAVRGAGK